MADFIRDRPLAILHRLTPLLKRLYGLSGLTNKISRSESASTALRIGVTLIMICFSLWRISQIGWREVAANLPASPYYYLLFALTFLVAPIFDALIFKRIWDMPLNALIPVMFRKRVLNEVVVGYSGEAFLGFLAKEKLERPFGRIFHDVKDSNLISSFVALSATVLLTAIALLPIASGAKAALAAGIATGIGILTAAFALRRRVLSMDDDVARHILFLHLARLLIVLALQIGQWSVALPATPLSAWLALMAAFFLATRIPLLPSYDLILLSLGLAVAPMVSLPLDAAAGLFVAGAALSQLSNLAAFLLTTPVAQAQRD